MTEFTEETRKQIAVLCRKNKVRELCMFGSRARGDYSEGSDFDMLVEFYPDSGISLFEFSRMQIDLEDLLGKKVDLVSKKGLKPLIRDSVLSESKVIYAD